MSISGYDNNYVLRETDGASVVGNSNSSKRLLTKWYLEDNPSIFCGSSKWLEYVGSSTNDDLCLRAGNCQVNSYTSVYAYYNSSYGSPSAPTETNVTVFGVYPGSSETSSNGFYHYADQDGPIMYFSSSNTETIVWGCVFEFSPTTAFTYFPHANQTSNEVVGSASFNWNGTKNILNNGYLGTGGTFAAWTTQNYILGSHAYYNCVYYPFLFSVTSSTTGVQTSGNNCNVRLLDLITSTSINSCPIPPGSTVFTSRGSSGNGLYYRFSPNNDGLSMTSMDWFLQNSQILEPHAEQSGSTLANNFNNSYGESFIMFYDTISASEWNAFASAQHSTYGFDAKTNWTTGGWSCRAAIHIGGVYVKRNQPTWNLSNGHKYIYFTQGDTIAREVSIYNTADSSYYYGPSDSF